MCAFSMVKLITGVFADIDELYAFAFGIPMELRPFSTLEDIQISSKDQSTGYMHQFGEVRPFRTRKV